AAKQPKLPRFIFGLGIRHVGVQTAIDLAETFHSIDRLAGATIDDLQEVDGVGDIVAESILAWFADADNQALLDKFERLGVRPYYASHADGPLHGKSFVVTGTLTGIGRDEVAAKVRELGGTFQSSVGKDTTYLVVGENVGEAKLAKARKLGTAEISERDLRRMIG
ncbi:MAG: helix-hairpin-helix domain-containing protein, partial [Candidatus Micrarchaeaceae archaeon]